jgi:predicted Na+-dependent transporter
MTIHQLTNVLVTVTLVEMMAATGLGVTFGDLARVARDWRLVVRAALANYVLVPAATVGLLLLFGAQPAVAVGFLILAVCPGAPYGPPFTAIAKGNVAVAVGLMLLLAASSALLAPVLLHLLLPLAAGGESLTVSAAAVLGTLLVTQLLPLCAGMAVRRWLPAVAGRLQRPANLASKALNLAVVGFVRARRTTGGCSAAANNWRLQRRFFGSFVPVLDFIHVLSYVFAAAMAGRPFAAGWACYRQWIGWVWQGRVGQVIAALDRRQAELGPPEPGEPESSPRQVVAGTRTYLGNHQDKVRYDEYRRQGLPLTSSLMESVVKEVSRRVKGTEKFWSEGGAEAILQLRADHLSDDEPLEGFWQRRQEAATGQRRYRRAG